MHSRLADVLQRLLALLYGRFCAVRADTPAHHLASERDLRRLNEQVRAFQVHCVLTPNDSALLNGFIFERVYTSSNHPVLGKRLTTLPLCRRHAGRVQTAILGPPRPQR